MNNQNGFDKRTNQNKSQSLPQDREGRKNSGSTIFVRIPFPFLFSQFSAKFHLFWQRMEKNED